MYRKIKNIFCHPAFLGMYIKDKVITAIGYSFAFFLVMVILLAVRDMHTPLLDRNLAQEISSAVCYDIDTIDTKYENYQLTGSKKVISYSSVSIHLNENNFTPSLTDTVSLVFAEHTAYFYMASLYIGQIEYKDLAIDNFSFQSIRDGKSIDKIAFTELVYQTLQIGESTYKAIYFFSDLSNILIYYAISFVISFVLAFFVNPPIDSKIRLKLVIYDSISFFIVTCYGLLFSASWLLYVAAVFPCVYVIFTFTHIKKITFKKGGNPNDN